MSDVSAEVTKTVRGLFEKIHATAAGLSMSARLATADSWDSCYVLYLIEEIEACFGVRFTPAELKVVSFVNPNEAAEAVAKKVRTFRRAVGHRGGRHGETSRSPQRS